MSLCVLEERRRPKCRYVLCRYLLLFYAVILFVLITVLGCWSMTLAACHVGAKFCALKLFRCENSYCCYPMVLESFRASQGPRRPHMHDMIGNKTECRYLLPGISVPNAVIYYAVFSLHRRMYFLRNGEVSAAVSKRN